MSARSILIAIAVLIPGNPALSEAPKAPTEQRNPPASRAAEVVLASAEELHSPAPSADQAATTPVRRPRAARVTTCRCGDSPNP